ncbi:MAG: hypothetical protein LBC96_03460 [Lachnospiraceae bacterium]|nr:hypothetical protein [Lachnospiraceae bacterium]
MDERFRSHARTIAYFLGLITSFADPAINKVIPMPKARGTVNHPIVDMNNTPNKQKRKPSIIEHKANRLLFINGFALFVIS